MINWENERAAENYCGYCIDITCVCNGDCFKDETNREKHIERELININKRLADLLFDQLEWDSFHDVVLDAMKISLNQEGLETIFWQLPEHTRALAFQWGLSDTVFRDDAYIFLEKTEIDIK